MFVDVKNNKGENFRGLNSEGVCVQEVSKDWCWIGALLQQPAVVSYCLWPDSRVCGANSNSTSIFPCGIPVSLLMSNTIGYCSWGDSMPCFQKHSIKFSYCVTGSIHIQCTAMCLTLFLETSFSSLFASVAALRHCSTQHCWAPAYVFQDKFRLQGFHLNC